MFHGIRKRHICKFPSRSKQSYLNILIAVNSSRAGIIKTAKFDSIDSTFQHDDVEFWYR